MQRTPAGTGSFGAKGADPPVTVDLFYPGIYTDIDKLNNFLRTKDKSKNFDGIIGGETKVFNREAAGEELKRLNDIVSKQANAYRKQAYLKGNQSLGRWDGGGKRKKSKKRKSKKRRSRKRKTKRRS